METKAGTAEPGTQAKEDRPPRITFGEIQGGIRLPAPGVLWLVKIAKPRLTLRIQTEGSSLIRSRRVVFDERVLDLPPLAEPKDQLAEDLTVDLTPQRRVRMAVEAANENGTRRTESIDMVYIPPRDTPIPEAKPRLIVMSVGVEKTRNPAVLPPIPFADRDAKVLADFLSDHLVSPDGTGTVQDRGEDRQVMIADEASVGSIGKSVERLGEWRRSGRIQKGDIVVLVIASHVLELAGTPTIATTDTDRGLKPTPSPVVVARDLSERLGELADYGCRVVLFLDGVHEPSPIGFTSEIKDWVRDLQRERRVITFVASREGPSTTPDMTERHGMFALGVTRAFQQVVAANKSQNQSYTLEEFGRAVKAMVLDLSGRQQEAQLYIPRGVLPDSLFARP